MHSAVLAHCLSIASFFHHHYALVSDKSLLARLVRITYEDSSGKGKPEEGLAFFVEHFEALATRTDTRIVEIDGFYPLDAEPYEMGVMDVFQYMIGNTDWSAVYQHNILLLRSADGLVTAVPYDFDWSGVINAHYARPGEALGTRSVRTRVYRGMCRPREQMQPVFQRLIDERDETYALYRGDEHLDPRRLEKSLEYFDDFYATLESPEQLQKGILGACRLWERDVARKAGGH